MFSNAGGSVGTMYKGRSLGSGNSFTGTFQSVGAAIQLVDTGSVNISGGINMGAIGYFGWVGRSLIRSPADGNIKLSNNAETAFGLLQFGGTTSSFPALKASGSSLQVRLADDTGYVGIYANDFRANGTPTSAAGQISIGGTHATTIGAAGAASALPATPLGYMNISVDGAAAKIPYYNP